MVLERIVRSTLSVTSRTVFSAPGDQKTLAKLQKSFGEAPKKLWQLSFEKKLPASSRRVSNPR